MKNTPLMQMKGITKDDGIILDGISDSLSDEKAWYDGMMPMGGVMEGDSRPKVPFVPIPIPGCCGGGSGSIITEKEIIL
ncbi:hypothetical protein [Treponema pedis]|uniref:hypothetical protein n=1 Tax=Treponema pedis TaxID=409322 RepID=UPI00041B510A|nr:hypothetical protein [Treponema pedis]